MKYLFFILLMIPYSIFAQIDMSVNKNSGGSDRLKIVNNCQITFDSVTDQDVMYVKKKDGTTDVYKLKDVKYILFDEITGIENNITNLFNLENYPNPFEEKTTIAFSLEKRGKVELNIFDLNGNIIKPLINDFYEAGEYQAEWDGKNSSNSSVAAGLYFIQLNVDNVIITRQIIIIK